MKIGLVTPGGFDSSGEERVIPVFLWLVKRLAKQHEVHVITLNQYSQSTQYPLLGAMVHNIGYRNDKGRIFRQSALVLQLLNREHKKRRFDVIHGLWATHSGLLAAVFGRLKGVSSVVTVAGAELVALPQIGYGAQLRLRDRMVVSATLRLASTVTCATTYMLNKVTPRRPDAQRVPLGVDRTVFSPAPIAPHGPPWRLLHVASLNRVKDQPTLLRAFAKIHELEPSAQLDIVGIDTLDGEIQSLAASLRLQDSVTFHGFEGSASVAARLQQTHLLLHSSLSEAGQVVLLEAAACGVPTVGTAVGYSADLSPGAAVAVSVGDSEALARAALELLRNPIRRAVVSTNALTFAREYDADYTANRMEELYAERACSH